MVSDERMDAIAQEFGFFYACFELVLAVQKRRVWSGWGMYNIKSTQRSTIPSQL